VSGVIGIRPDTFTAFQAFFLHFPISMKFMKIYLIGYFVLLLGAFLALWQSGVLRHVSDVWLAIGALIAIGFGIMLAVASGRPAVTTRE
jgi:hypothetical protein